MSVVHPPKSHVVKAKEPFDQLQRAYDLRHPLQRPVVAEHPAAISDLIASWSHAPRYLGKEEYYPDFLAYFQRAIDMHGYEKVINEHLLKRTDAANDLLIRLHAGVVHPLLQLMYGLEWKQPAIVAEALAQTCVHDIEGLDQLLLASEQQAKACLESTSMPLLLSLYEEARANHQLRDAVRMEDEDKTRDGILQRAKDPMVSLLKRVQVSPEELEERTAEMFHAIILVGSSAAVHPPHHVKFDFFLMHHINSALIYLTFNAQSWISSDDKVRLLEWKIRMDLLQYAARACPRISVDAIRYYAPKEPSSHGSVRAIGATLISFGDDGHAIKQARATAVCHELIKLYENKPWAVLKEDSTWENIQHMVVDSLEGPGMLYVRCAGLDEVWKDIPQQSAPKRAPELLRAFQTGSGSSEEVLGSKIAFA
ncbi:hypothetical protein FDECE_17886 [Fusarium decemcellulare]|nr:hypothetical protein FDECE_17886 [Fusarium decemcellulare]